MDIDRQALIRLFLHEAEETLDALEAALTALEASPGDRGVLWQAFRPLHTLKGDAGTVGFGGLAELAHHCEEVVEALHQSGHPADDAILTLLFEAADGLRESLANAADGTEGVGDPELIERLRSTAEQARSEDPPGAARELAEGRDLKKPTADSSARLPVELDRLDRLVELISEVSVSRHRVGRMLSVRRPVDQILETHQEADRLFEELHELVMSLRMVPVGRLLRRFGPTLRRAAEAEKKRARLVTVGDTEEIDARLAEALREPLSHMVRNAVAHGIESPEARQTAAKEATGVVTLSARRERGRVVITVADDGSGLDVEALARRAGTSIDSEVTEAQLLDWISTPGLSTREEAGVVSGRGVGMDVVRRQVEELRGSVELSTVEGRGTEIRLSLPSSLALIEALEVAVGGETFLVPLDSIERTVALPDDESPDADQGLLPIDGELVPWLRLRRRLATSPAPAGRESVIFVRHGDRRGGLVVDGLLGQSQHLIRPLAAPVVDVGCIDGSSLLTDGRVALILDVGSLIGSFGSAADRRRQIRAGQTSSDISTDA